MNLTKFLKNGTFLLLLVGSTIFSQVGINTITPNSTLVVDGSLETAYKEISSLSYTMQSSDYYITYNGTDIGFITLPNIETSDSKKFTGRVYKIKNISSSMLYITGSGSDKLRPSNTSVTSFGIPHGRYVELICNGNNSGGATWDISFLGNSSTSPSIDFTLFQLKIPPHGSRTADFTNHTNSAYDSDNWHVISKSSVNAEVTGEKIIASAMTIVYEYQGTPFDTSDLYPIITTGNDSNYGDSHSASFLSLTNVNGKTRLTIKVTRIDYVDPLSNNSDWAGVFFMNILFMDRS